jgi:hypothetical protein
LQYQPNLPSPTPQDPTWRSRPSDFRRYQDSPRNLSNISPIGQFQPQSGSNYLPPFMPSDRSFEVNTTQTFRTLPPPRAVSTLPHLGRAMEPPRPMSTGELQHRTPQKEETRSIFDRSENDAANALAGLATGMSHPETNGPRTHPPPRPPSR